MNLLVDIFGLLPTWAWIVIAVVIVAIIIAVVVLAKIVRANKRMMEGDKAESSSEESEVALAAQPEPVPAAQPEPVPAAQPKPIPTAQPKPVPAAQPKPIPAAQPKPIPAAQPKPIPAAQPKPVPTAQPKPASAATTAQSEQREQAKVYHITKRAVDGKWQVKFSKGKKAIKLFDTQAEAIDFAKHLAYNQDASIMIHKEDGSFRRLRYDKTDK